MIQESNDWPVQHTSEELLARGIFGAYSRAGKNLVFWNFLIGFLGFNVHNAEYRYMTHDK